MAQFQTRFVIITILCCRPFDGLFQIIKARPVKQMGCRENPKLNALYLLCESGITIDLGIPCADLTWVGQCQLERLTIEVVCLRRIKMQC